MTQLSDEVVERATLIRDEMINVARALADRGFGATQSEMREAQIEYLAGALSDLTKEWAQADRITPEWCTEMAKLELGHEVGAGMLAIDPVPEECPHAAPFRYCEACKVSPCPIGLGKGGG